MITVKDKEGKFHELESLIINKRPFAYIYQGTKLIWSAVSKIWRDRDKWKDKDVWKY